MKINLTNKRRPHGFILLLVLILSTCSIFILVGVMHRTSTVSMLNLRNTQLSALNNAAEAATEKVYDNMAWDFKNYGPARVSSNAPSYSTNVPSASDNAYWSRVQFSDAQGNIGQTYVGFLTNYTGPLPSQYTNQFATTSPIYRIVSNAKMPNSLAPGVVGTAQEDVLLAEVPITTYAIFYNGPLEFSDCAVMQVNGRVHSNQYICVGSGSALTFNSMVTCCGTISEPGRGGTGPWSTSNWNVSFNGSYQTNVSSINLSMSMTNTHAIIDIPPPSSVESPMSSVGQSRLFNEAQVVIIVTNPVVGLNPTVYVTLQTAYNGQNPGSDTSKGNYTLANTIDTNLDNNSTLSLPFLSVTNTFYDQRQGVTNFVTEIDVSGYISWLATNLTAIGKFSSAPADILYVADRRNVNSTTRQAAIRLVNATKLPYNNDLGFTVATQNPLYVKGNYNTTVTGVSGNSLGLGATTNGASVPAALLCDAITILSTNWQDNNSSSGFSARHDPANMTLNAALVTGAIPSTGTDANTFSGGVQNLTRFLEDWSGYTLTLNTSIVNLYNSQIATNQFKMPGIYYNPPTRLWGFDTTYYSPDKQPPGIPCALVPIRFNWKTPPPTTITSN
jgi:hypothetical protein